MGQHTSRQAKSVAGSRRLPGQLQFVLDHAKSLLQQGQLIPAAGFFRQILASVPEHPDSLHYLGIIELQQGHFDTAVELLFQAVRLVPVAPGPHCNLGLALQAAGRHTEALDSYDQALRLDPKFVEAHNNRANALREINRLDEAAAAYRKALKLRPGFAEARYNLAITLLALQQPELALTCLAECLRAAPGHPGILCQYGRALIQLGRPLEAVASLERALAQSPQDAELYYWLAEAQSAAQRSADAIDSYRRAIFFRPDMPELHYNLGNLLADEGRFDEALAAFDQALAQRPDYVEALYNRGGIFQDLRRHEEAARDYAALMNRVPEHRYAAGNLLYSHQFIGDWSQFDALTDILIQSVRSGRSRGMPLPFLAVSADPDLQLRCARDFTAANFALPAVEVPLGEATGDGRIRVAYLSPDFREHAVSYLMAGVFEQHDRARFEIIGLSLRAPDESSMTARVLAAFDRHIDVSGQSDEVVAGLLRKIGVDIVVDLAGYTQGNRTAILALRPAPIQVNYLGYPGSMGADFMDYLLADHFVVPEAAAAHYAEKIAYLPECFQANDDRRQIALQCPSRFELGLPEQGLVFCAFNSINKITPTIFSIWMRLLKAVPDSVLWFAADGASLRANLEREAGNQGVPPWRLVFSPRVRYPDHLARLQHADLLLDTVPFNGGTTTSDALWAGLPVLTCTGDAFSARMAGSLLHAIGLPELVASDLAAYEQRAMQLAHDPGQLRDLRGRLAANKDLLPLFDTARFCRHLEAAYESMHVRRLRGELPESFCVKAMANSSNDPDRVTT